METCGIAWRPAQMQTRAPDYEAVGLKHNPETLDFIEFQISG
jgi:hypothetical protein